MKTLHGIVKPLIHTAGFCIDIFSPLARMPLGQCEPCQATCMYCRGLYWYLSPLSTHLAEVCREATVSPSYPDCQDYRDHTFFHALTFAGFRGSWTRSRRLSVHCLNKKHLPRDPANVNALKQTCLIVILAFYMTPWKLPWKMPEKLWKCCFDTTVHIQRRHFVFHSFFWRHSARNVMLTSTSWIPWFKHGFSCLKMAFSGFDNGFKQLCEQIFMQEYILVTVTTLQSRVSEELWGLCWLVWAYISLRP